MLCEFCKNEFINKYTMQKHQQRAKYCIEMQKKMNIETKEDLKYCEYCEKNLNVIVTLDIRKHVVQKKIKLYLIYQKS